MKYKAVIFDLFETLITEWGHKKYTKSEMSSDLGVDEEEFNKYWDEKENDRYLGTVDFIDSLLFVCEKCGKHVENSTLSAMTEKRIKTKAACFHYVHPDVYRLLEHLRAAGLSLAIVSNCSAEEVTALRQSKIYPYFDQILLSYEVKMQKPDTRIYAQAAKLLGVSAYECLFVGDGGSNELPGAKTAGMTALQAKWYTNQLPHKRDNIPGFLTAESPLDIFTILEQQP